MPSKSAESSLVRAQGPDRREFLKQGAAFGAAALGGLLTAPSLARAATDFKGRKLVFASWGGSYQDTEKVCYCDPFAAKTGATVLQDGPMDQAKFRVMVEGGQPIWDVGDITLDFLHVGIKDNLFEKLDLTRLDTARVTPNFVSDYGIANIAFSYNIAYNTKMIKPGEHPKSWAEVFDLKRFPGSRTFNDRPTPVLEIALMADGVPMDKLYPLDVDRAFKKLDTIKSSIVFWATNSQSQQLIIDGQASCGVVLNGRIYDAVVKGGNMGIEWNQNIQSAGYWSIPRGSKNVDVAHGLISEMMNAENQAKLANMIAYSPTNPAAFKDIDAKIAPWLSTEPGNVKLGFTVNGAYWAEKQRELTERWNAWKLA